MIEDMPIVKQAFLVAGDFAFIFHGEEEKGYPYILAVDCRNDKYRVKLIHRDSALVMSTSSIKDEDRRKDFAQTLELNQEFLMEGFYG